MVFASLFQDVIVQPIFNLLVAIYALLPGHDFGLAIIIFTIVVRLLMWPLVKKQLHQAKAMRTLQPELKRIKEASKGDKQKESMMLMELYKERGINPLGSIGTLVVQFIILLGLYAGLRHLLADPRAIIDNSYAFIRHLGWIQTLQQDIGNFHQHFFNLVDLKRSAVAQGKPIYWPAMALVLGSAAAQYMTSTQLMPKPKDGKTVRAMLKEAGQGKPQDQAEFTAAMTRSTRFLIPGMILLFTVNLPAALSLYWMVGGIVAYIQQARVLGKDEEEMEQLADEPDKKPRKDVRTIAEAEIVETTDSQTAGTAPAAKTKKSKTAHKKKRRK